MRNILISVRNIGQLIALGLVHKLADSGNMAQVTQDLCVLSGTHLPPHLP